MRKKVGLFAALGSAFASAPRLFFGGFLAIALYMGLEILRANLHRQSPTYPLGTLGLSLLAIVTQVILATALYQLALKRKGVGLLGLGVGANHFRLLASVFLQGMLLGVVFGLFSLIAFAVTAFTKHSGPLPPVRWDSWEGILAAASNPVYLATAVAWGIGILVCAVVFARMSLATPATIARSQVIVTTSFDLTHGSTIPLLAGLFVTALLPEILWGLGSRWVELDAHAVTRWTGGVISPAWLQTGLKTLLTDALSQVLSIGFLAAAYRQVSPPRAGSAPADIAA